MAGALGVGVPKRDLFVSPQHRILLSSPIAKRMFGSREVLVAAKKLTGLAGVIQASGDQSVTYVHFLCDRHEIVVANGVHSETLFVGSEAWHVLSPKARRMVHMITGLGSGKAASARPIISGRRLKRLLERHLQNGKPVWDGAEYCPELNQNRRLDLFTSEAAPSPKSGPISRSVAGRCLATLP